MKRKIGFSHGVLFKLLDVNKEESIKLLKECGSNAIEINCHHDNEVSFLNSLLPYIKTFDYKSLHAPVNVRYGNNDETRVLLSGLEDFYCECCAELIVIHPDLVDDWSVFNEFGMRFAIENMDDRKKNYKNLDDLKKFFNEHPDWFLVLDVGHVNSNDKTMTLAKDLIKSFKERVVEIHLSGYEKFHDPLHRTKQTEIINYCKNLFVPIIIESVFEPSDGTEGIKKEYNYILENLR